MRRVIPILSLALVLAVAACSAPTDPAQPEVTATSEAPTTSTPSDSQAPPAGEPADTTMTTIVEAPEEGPDGPLAPDFTLALGADGAGTFVLSQEVKPVFMVFWAEW